MPKGDKDISALLHQLEALRLEEQQLISRIRELTAKDTLKIGDRVRIRNKVTTKSNAPVTDPDRVGTITKITTDRISFTTDSGIRTWRAPKNLKKIIDNGKQFESQPRR